MGGMGNLASAGLNLALAQETRKRADKRLKKERNADIAVATAKAGKIERQQRDSLKKRIAAARARAGGAGSSTTGGSIDAVVKGLERETQRSLAALEDDTRHRVNSIRARAEKARRRNLLDFTGKIGDPTSQGSRKRSLFG